MNETDKVRDSLEHVESNGDNQKSLILSNLNKPHSIDGIKSNSYLSVFEIPEVAKTTNITTEKSPKKNLRTIYNNPDIRQLDDISRSNDVKGPTSASSSQTKSNNQTKINQHASLASFLKFEKSKFEKPKFEKSKMITNDLLPIHENIIDPYKEIKESSGISKSSSFCIKATFIEQSGRVARTGDLGAVQPKQLAKNLFNLVNVTKNHVSRILTRHDAYHTEACKEYMNLFALENLQVDEALRLLMKKIPFIGETHSIEKMLTHFTHRYWMLNKNKLNFNEAVCHLLICSILILNSDLHSKIKMKKMSLDEYIQNIYSVCNHGESLPDKEYLTNIYKQIKKKPLPTHPLEVKKSLPSQTFFYPSSTLPPQLKSEFTVVKTGALYWKELREPGLFASIGNSWKLSYVSIIGSDLIFHKKERIPTHPTHTISLTHSFAKTYIKASSTRHTFVLLVITGKSYLFSDTLQSSIADWITHINITAALLSSLPLPLSLGNPPFYTKLLSYPTQPYTGLIKDLYIHITAREKELLNILNLNLAYVPGPDEKIAAAQSIALIQREIDRYGNYKMMLKYSKKEFLQKFLPVDSKSLEGFQEYVEKELETQNNDSNGI